MLAAAATNSGLRNRYVVFAWLAFLWAVGNSVYVYLVLGGERAFRVESADERQAVAHRR